MTESIPTTVVIFKTLTLLVGGFITLVAANAARKTRWTGLSYLAIGFGIVTAGSFFAGVGDQLLLISTHDALLVESALTTLGFLVIAYSLFATQT
ncbi:hypothetical protein SAMN05216388_10853 [Halorientalis persicus]|uniref:Uncharacterized protein n=1 Tax=Halorientalis persicus TaxID=1367881 RepID=A0A1H8WWW6_9EURY|nr:hypothetical protein [Halorientalis persicus]SEP32122.1 hypothetical protein SAMN05216388_10853 [Halorientalis persicus]